MKEFLNYSWGVMKEDFKAQFAVFVAIRNWVNYWANYKA